MNGSLLLGIGMDKNVLYCLTTTSISLLVGSFLGDLQNSRKICYTIWLIGALKKQDLKSQVLVVASVM